MTKIISKVGNSNGIILDATLMDMAHLKTGDEMNVEVHGNGVLTLTPLRRKIDAKKAGAVAARLIRKNSELFRRLS
jgi:antitoxin component of MazEF toxin-antitoxin module